MLEKSCYSFLDALASREPVPGGGGASALAGSLGMALGCMVGNLTAGKKTYADVEEDIQALLVKSRELMARFNRLVAEDAEVFEPLARAYGMPRGTPEEKQKKEQVLQAALVQAARVPLEIARCSLAALKLLDEYAQKGSRLVVSDAGTGALLCKAALQGAGLNVLVNLKLMKDENLKKELAEELAALEREGLALADRIYSSVRGQLCS